MPIFSRYDLDPKWGDVQGRTSASYTNTVTPTLSESAPKVGDVLTANPGTWSPTPPDGFAYAWQRSSDGVTFSRSPTSANQSTYVVQTGDAGYEIQCQVAPVDNAHGGNLWAQSAHTAITSAVTSGSGTSPSFGGPVIYAATSPWNTPIPANAPIRPDSAELITGVWDDSGGHPHAFGPAPSYSFTEWMGPRQNVGRTWAHTTDTTVGLYLDFPTLKAQFFNIPIPSNLVYQQDFGSSDTEHRTVIQVDDGSTWNIEYLTPPETAPEAGGAADAFWHAVVCEHRGVSPDTSGWEGLGTGYHSDGVTAWGAGAASKIPMDAGLMTGQDWANVPVGGHLNHALNFNISNTAAASNDGGAPRFVWPAAGGDGTTAGANAIPMGARGRLKQSVDVESLSIPEWQKVILRTLQIYGFIVTDTAGAQGAGDGIMCQFPQAQQAGAFGTYPWVTAGDGWSYGNSIASSLYGDFEIIDWEQSVPGITVPA